MSAGTVDGYMCPMTFNYTFVNKGTAYNRTKGVMTIPTNGIYYVTLSALIRTSHGAANYSLLVNSDTNLIQLSYEVYVLSLAYIFKPSANL